MAQEQEAPKGDEQQEFNKADPKLNPRNQALAEIASSVAKQHEKDFAEDNNVSSIDDEGNVTPPPSEKAEAQTAVTTEQEEQPAETATQEEPAAPAATSAPAEEEGISTIEPDAEYEVQVDGVPLKVTGQKLIDAGVRTFQKETAADYRLKQATEKMREADELLSKAREQTAQPQVQPQPQQPQGPSVADLQAAIQYGTPEQAQAAITLLMQRGSTSQQDIARMAETRARAAARDEALFNKAVDYLQTEHGDLLKHDHLKRFIFAEENRYRAPKQLGGLGDQRPYIEVYKEIAENIRKDFNLPKPNAQGQPSSQPSTPGTAAVRVARKAAAPSVPKTAAARLDQAEAQAKPKSTSDVIAAMAASRGKDRLSQPKRG